MRILISACFLFFTLAVPAMAKSYDNSIVTVDLASDHVDITTGFNGAKLALFGMKREDGDVVVVIRGPRRSMVARHRRQVMGVWTNYASVTFGDVPVYYDIAIGRPLSAIAMPDVLREQGIGLDSFTFSHFGREDAETVKAFREGLIRNKQSQGHYPLSPRNIVFLNGDFFRADFYVPPDVPTGDYKIDAYLFRDGNIIDRQETALRVGQVGFSAWLQLFAYTNGFAYGLVTIMMAMLAGWMAYAISRRN
ncbi:MAG: TIGR02186 family protein [Proteobacteria bacterium]|nr:TIGR02186 family protein [Pseudomonadota bacterium]